MLRQYGRTWRTAALAWADLMAVAAAFLAAYVLRQQLAFILHKPVWTLSFYGGFFAASVLVYMGAFSLQGLYREVREGDWVDVAFRVAKGATLGALILMASTFILDMRSYSRLIVIGIVAPGRPPRLRRPPGPVRAVRPGPPRPLDPSPGGAVGGRPGVRPPGAVLRENPELGWEPVRLRRTPWRGRPAAEAGRS